MIGYLRLTMKSFLSKIKFLLIKILISFVDLLFFLKVGRIVLRFVFYNILVRLYKYYLFIIKVIKKHNIKKYFFAVIFHQKLVHILVVLLTLIIVFNSLSSSAKSKHILERGHHTILYSLVTDELEDLNDNEYIIEEADDSMEYVAVQENYLNNMSAIRSKQQVIIEDPNKIDNNSASITQEGSAIIKPNIASTKKVKRPREEIIYYTVKGGDTISTIAFEFDVSVNTILWENNLSSYSLIRPGQKL